MTFNGHAGLGEPALPLLGLPLVEAEPGRQPRSEPEFDSIEATINRIAGLRINLKRSTVTGGNRLEDTTIFCCPSRPV